MRIAALYDIHANLPALEAVLADVDLAAVDRIVIGGDVFPGPMPRETLARLRQIQLPVVFIEGNGDRVVRACMNGQEPVEVPVAFREPIWWNASQLESDREYLQGPWPATLRMELGGLGAVLFCHATPRSDSEIFTRRTPERPLIEMLEPLAIDVLVCGHTHMQFDRTVGSTRIVNAGSVGMPFGSPGAYWLLIGDGIELRRTDYDLAAAAVRIRATEYPHAAAFAEGNVLDPPTEQTMLSAFANAELKSERSA